jgi:hypothetical protein
MMTMRRIQHYEAQIAHAVHAIEDLSQLLVEICMSESAVDYIEKANEIVKRPPIRSPSYHSATARPSISVGLSATVQA